MLRLRFAGGPIPASKKVTLEVAATTPFQVIYGLIEEFLNRPPQENGQKVTVSPEEYVFWSLEVQPGGKAKPVCAVDGEQAPQDIGLRVNAYMLRRRAVAPVVVGEGPASPVSIAASSTQASPVASPKKSASVDPASPLGFDDGTTGASVESPQSAAANEASPPATETVDLPPDAARTGWKKLRSAVALSAPVTCPTFRERLVAICKAYDPAALATVDSVLKRCAGKEEALIASAVRTYGPEPLAGAVRAYRDAKAKDKAAEDKVDADKARYQEARSSGAMKTLRKLAEHYNPAAPELQEAELIPKFVAVEQSAGQAGVVVETFLKMHAEKEARLRCLFDEFLGTQADERHALELLEGSARRDVGLLRNTSCDDAMVGWFVIEQQYVGDLACISSIESVEIPSVRAHQELARVELTEREYTQRGDEALGEQLERHTVERHEMCGLESCHRHTLFGVSIYAWFVIELLDIVDLEDVGRGVVASKLEVLERDRIECLQMYGFEACFRNALSGKTTYEWFSIEQADVFDLERVERSTIEQLLVVTTEEITRECLVGPMRMEHDNAARCELSARQLVMLYLDVDRHEHHEAEDIHRMRLEAQQRLLRDAAARSELCDREACERALAISQQELADRAHLERLAALSEEQTMETLIRKEELLEFEVPMREATADAWLFLQLFPVERSEHEERELVTRRARIVRESHVRSILEHEVIADVEYIMRAAFLRSVMWYERALLVPAFIEPMEEINRAVLSKAEAELRTSVLQKGEEIAARRRIEEAERAAKEDAYRLAREQARQRVEARAASELQAEEEREFHEMCGRQRLDVRHSEIESRRLLAGQEAKAFLIIVSDFRAIVNLHSRRYDSPDAEEDHNTLTRAQTEVRGFPREGGLSSGGEDHASAHRPPRRSQSLAGQRRTLRKKRSTLSRVSPLAVGAEKNEHEAATEAPLSLTELAEMETSDGNFMSAGSDQSENDASKEKPEKSPVRHHASIRDMLDAYQQRRGLGVTEESTESSKSPPRQQQAAGGRRSIHTLKRVNKSISDLIAEARSRPTQLPPQRSTNQELLPDGGEGCGDEEDVFDAVAKDEESSRCRALVCEVTEVSDIATLGWLLIHEGASLILETAALVSVEGIHRMRLEAQQRLLRDAAARSELSDREACERALAISQQELADRAHLERLAALSEEQTTETLIRKEELLEFEVMLRWLVDKEEDVIRQLATQFHVVVHEFTVRSRISGSQVVEWQHLSTTVDELLTRAIVAESTLSERAVWFTDVALPYYASLNEFASRGVLEASEVMRRQALHRHAIALGELEARRSLSRHLTKEELRQKKKQQQKCAEKKVISKPKKDKRTKDEFSKSYSGPLCASRKGEPPVPPRDCRSPEPHVFAPLQVRTRAVLGLAGNQCGPPPPPPHLRHGGRKGSLKPLVSTSQRTLASLLRRIPEEQDEERVARKFSLPPLEPTNQS